MSTGECVNDLENGTIGDSDGSEDLAPAPLFRCCAMDAVFYAAYVAVFTALWFVSGFVPISVAFLFVFI
jgi:hypothetical protein